MTSNIIFKFVILAGTCALLTACGKKGTPLAPEGEDPSYPSIYPTED